MNISINLLERAKLPQRQHESDAGYDLSAYEDGTILARSSLLVRTGVSMAIPMGFYGRVAPRSGLACKSGIDVGAGVIDSGYRGEIKVLLRNTSDLPFNFRAGERIAQLIIEKCHSATFEVVENLDETERKSGGFGSTGV